jgi:hypothetical protein
MEPLQLSLRAGASFVSRGLHFPMLLRQRSGRRSGFFRKRSIRARASLIGHRLRSPGQRGLLGGG